MNLHDYQDLERRHNILRDYVATAFVALAAGVIIGVALALRVML